MYAIVEINGQQFKAEAGKKLFVHHIAGAEAGQAAEFEKVLLVDNNGTITVGAPTVEGAKAATDRSCGADPPASPRGTHCCA